MRRQVVVDLMVITARDEARQYKLALFAIGGTFLLTVGCFDTAVRSVAARLAVHGLVEWLPRDPQDQADVQYLRVDLETNDPLEALSRTQAAFDDCGRLQVETYYFGPIGKLGVPVFAIEPHNEAEGEYLVRMAEQPTTFKPVYADRARNLSCVTHGESWIGNHAVVKVTLHATRREGHERLDAFLRLALLFQELTQQ